jgi:Fic family protein
MTYNWQHTDWPDFRYDVAEIEDEILQFYEKAGLISGIVRSLPENTRLEAVIEVMVAEAIKTSEIEGEFLSRKDVISSIRNALGLNAQMEQTSDQRSANAGQLMIDVRETFADPLTAEQLFAWHSLLLGTEKGIKIGGWRDHEEPMQVISGAMGKTVVHFEAPPSARVPQEMARFLDWFNRTAPGQPGEIRKAPLRCAIAHLYFETIHPFEDGNGRIGRAIAEKALSQGLNRPALLSLSRTIELNKKQYYEALKTAQTSLEITPWINYFVDVIMDAQQYAEEQIGFALQKTLFFDRYRDQLSERQLKVVRRVFEEGPGGFQGGLNAAKYGSLTRISKATATRDLQELLSKGIILPLGEGGGRSTKYQLNLERGATAKSEEPPLADKLREIIRTASEAKQSNQFRQGPDHSEPPGEDEIIYRRRGR